MISDGKVEWSYSGALGPENWGSLSAEYVACSTGEMQSPVDITSFVDGGESELAFSYSGDAKELSYNGVAISIAYEMENYLNLGNRVYSLSSVHHHIPSEHQIDGESFALELHLVHEREVGDEAVAAFLYSLGESDPVIQSIIDAVPAVGETVSDSIGLNAKGYEPDDVGYYGYRGSYTTPPCKEPVDWLVMHERRSVSREQVDALLVLTGIENSRPVQAIGNREIISYGSGV